MNFFRPVLAKALSPMVVRVFLPLKVMLENLVQPAKASLPMETTLAGMVILLSCSQTAAIRSGITVRVLGRVRVLR